MLIVEIIGGLGNQMFQYAFYKSLLKKYGKGSVQLYIGRFSEVSDNKGFEIGKVFGINNDKIYKYNVVELIDDSYFFLSRIRRKLLGGKKTYFGEANFKFDAKVYQLGKRKTVYFRGLWQDELYFKDIREELLISFKFKKNLIGVNLEVFKRIKTSNSVSVHIRRGDYISNMKYKSILGGICNSEYYKKSVDLISAKVIKPTFFIFSDDIKWVQRNFIFFNDYDVCFIDHNSGLESYLDMQLMSICEHNIIANSSFSWWAAWLNKNNDKIVIAPETWFKNNTRLEDNHIVPDDWFKIKN